MTNPVQEWSGYAYGSSATATAGAVPTAGNGVVIVIGLRTNFSVTSVTDNQTGSPNTYTRAVTSAGPDSDVDIWYCNSLTINQSSFTLTVTPSATIGIQIFAAEIVGLNGVDQTNSSNSSGSSSVTTLAVTNSSANTNANDIVIAGFTTTYLSGSTIGLTGPAATGYTNIGDYDYINNQSSNGSYKIVNAIETSSATFSWTTATPYVTAAIASFKVGTPPTISVVPSSANYINNGTSPATMVYEASLSVGQVGLIGVLNKSGNHSMTVSDNKSGAYTQIYNYYSSALGGTLSFWYVNVTVAGAATITVTANAGDAIVSACLGLQGFVGQPAIDVAIESNFGGTATTAVSMTPISNNYANELTMVANLSSSYITSGYSGWTEFYSGQSQFFYAIQASASTANPFSATMAGSANWAGIVAGLYDTGPSPPAIFTNRRNVLYFI